ASVDVFQSGSSTRIGGGVATWSDQVFPLDQGIQLLAGASISATQSQDGAISMPSPAPVQIQSTPPMVAAVLCPTHVYVSGQALQLLGRAPGATATVTVNGEVRGSGVSADGTVTIELSQPTQAGDTLVVTQTACGIAGPPIPLPQ